MYQPPAPATIQPPAPTSSAMANAATLTHSPFLATGFGVPEIVAVLRVAGSSTNRGETGGVGACGTAAERAARSGTAEVASAGAMSTVGAKVAGNAATHSMQYLANGRLSVLQLGHVVAIRPALAGRARRRGR